MSVIVAIGIVTWNKFISYLMNILLVLTVLYILWCPELEILLKDLWVIQ